MDEPTPTESPDGRLIRLVRQLTVESDRFAEMLGEAHDMHRTDLNALVVIMDAERRGQPISPSQLARSLHLSASATTALLDRLEAIGHVNRGRSTTDRRRIELAMPDRARELGRHFFAPLAAEYARVWSRFSPEQRAVITEFLTATIEATVTVRGGISAESRNGPPAG
ncbi:DNA-binding MarR family transcriptional regulator [Stackebrandtia albiflava]|uniref:DNA-binding MarR family transcriptional regulator n=1 Tax=Stackebrandtia albiflava TaxID=406432 RepID=A0A562V9Q9_9ACTN|nr:MarR family transcriptional regulator [Stackebrandtia albiflava]TWJ14595.1 DNA-binding MarR family transcriptional regulator [Stackebrandtia albiflava]